MPLPGSSRSDNPDTPLAFRIARGGMWVTVSSYFNIGFGFLANLVLTRLLVEDDFGIFVLAGFFFSLLNIRPKIGISQAFAQRKETTGELIGSHLTLDVAAGVGTVLLAMAAVPVLRLLGYSWDVVWVTLALAGIGVAESLFGTASVLLDRGLHFGRSSLVSSLAFPISYIPAFVVALNGGAYWSLVTLSASYALLQMIGFWWAMKTRMPETWRLKWRFQRSTASSLLKFGSVVGLASVAGVLVAQFDYFLVGTFVSVAMLGFYERAYKIAQWPSQLLNGVINRASLYVYARLQDDRARLQKSMTMTIWLVTTLALPVALAVFVAAPDLVRLLYGDRWLPSALFLRFLVGYAVMRPLIDNSSSLFVGVGKPRFVFLVAAIQAGVLIAIGTPLTLFYGAVGTSIAVGVTFMVGVGLAYRFIQQVVSIRFWDSIGLPATACIVVVAGYLLLNRVVDLNSLPLIARVVCKMVYAAISYFGTLYVLQPGLLLDRTSYAWRLVRGKSEA